jgi:hypothetical protein
MEKKINIKLVSIIAGIIIAFSGCTDDFLKPDPLSFFEPSITFRTREGLQSALTTCDKHLRHYFTNMDGTMMSPLLTEMFLSDICVNGFTDIASPTGTTQDVITQLVPDGSNDGAGTNRTAWFWNEGYSGIKYANSIITNIDRIDGLEQNLRNEMLGRAYFHRSLRYMHLIFQFGDVPLLTQEVQGPKFDYRPTKVSVILDKITTDMEFAVEHVPAEAEYGGMVNKGACRQLLIKCYLAQREFDKAIDQANKLIDNSGYALMMENFGTFVNPMPEIHPITRNVIWDLHRPENKAIPANKEVLHYLVNREESASSRVNTSVMRNAVPFWSSTGSIGILTPDGKNGMDVSTAYFDYRKAYGRGIACIRSTWYSTHTVWLDDPTDLRHSVEHGNWMIMENLKYNHPALFASGNLYAGQNIRLFDDENNLLCIDTIRNWFDWPHYKTWVESPRMESSTNYDGGACDQYFYRLAETYLLRAEAYFWKGDMAKAADDVNIIRTRAHCTKMFTAADMNIGVIMDERARELYYEEWRHMELSRVSYIFALTGKADEFGKTYTQETLSDANYWYERVSKYNNFYNKGVKTRLGVSFTIAPYHILWPVPQSSINANREGRINQNKGYSGHEYNTAPFDNLEEAIAAESMYN